MKPLTLLTILLFAAISLFAQQTTRVYYSADDYRNGRYEALNYIAMVPLPDGGYDVDAYTYKAKNTIRKTAWGIERNDSLWLNTRIVLAPQPNYIPRRSGVKYKPKGYELVLFRSRNYMCFRGPRANVKGMYGQRYVATGSMAAPLPVAVVGNMAIAAVQTDQANAYALLRFNYLYDIAAEQPVFLSRGTMEEYYYSTAAKEDTAFRKFIITLAKAQQ